MFSSSLKLMESNRNYVLELNLISAQDLKLASPKNQTYAVTWVRPSSSKLRTRINSVGGANPTWNDKFIFRVSPDFLSKDTSAISVEIYSVGRFKDRLIGTVRVLLSNCLSSNSSSPLTGYERSPYFTALHVRRSSGSFHGILNVGLMVIKDSDFSSSALHCASALDYRHLMGKRKEKEDEANNTCRLWPGRRHKEHVSHEYVAEEEGDLDDKGKVIQRSNGNKGRKLLMCGFVFNQRKIHKSPSDGEEGNRKLADGLLNGSIVCT